MIEPALKQEIEFNTQDYSETIKQLMHERDTQIQEIKDYYNTNIKTLRIERAKLIKKIRNTYAYEQNKENKKDK